jgi:hypothetical protein
LRPPWDSVDTPLSQASKGVASAASKSVPQDPKGFGSSILARAAPEAEADNPLQSALLNELRAAPDNGLLEHDIPLQLTVFQEQEIEVRLSRGPAAEKFIQSLNEKAREIVEVRDFVSLSLYGGKNFDIERLSPDPQSMRQNNFCLWKFRVTPKRGGKHTLKIQVALYDSPAYVPVASYSRDVEVNVPFSSRVALMWEDYHANWLLTYLLLPLGASILTAWMTARMTVQPDPGNPKRGRATKESRATGSARKKQKEDLAALAQGGTRRRRSNGNVRAAPKAKASR